MCGGHRAVLGSIQGRSSSPCDQVNSKWGRLQDGPSLSGMGTAFGLWLQIGFWSLPPRYPGTGAGEPERPTFVNTFFSEEKLFLCNSLLIKTHLNVVLFFSEYIVSRNGLFLFVNYFVHNSRSRTWWWQMHPGPITYFVFPPLMCTTQRVILCCSNQLCRHFLLCGIFHILYVWNLHLKAATVTRKNYHVSSIRAR